MPRFCSSLASSLILALSVSTVTAAADQPAPPRSYPYKITTTIGMVTDIVHQIAGDKATVEGLIGEGVDPHLYLATRSDIGKLLSADIVLYSGLMLEGKMTDALIKVGRQRPVFALTEALDESLLLSPKEFQGHFDPHVWMSPVLWKKCAEQAARILGDFDPPNRDAYQSRYAAYATQLDALHAYAEKSLASIPKDQRVLITAHDAFNYFGRQYDVDVRGIQGISTESEAGLNDISRLVDLITQKKIRAVFIETSVSEKNVRALIEGAAARGATVLIGGLLFSDAMGKPGSYEGTYIGMIDHNVTTITRALGGTAPPRGMNGKLAATTQQDAPASAANPNIADQP